MGPATQRPRGAADATPRAPSDPSGRRAARCRDLGALASIEVYPAGLNPQRRFTLIGPVEAGPDTSELRRVARLQAEACALGADAVLGMSEHARRAGAPPDIARGYAVVYRDDTLARAGTSFDAASLWDPAGDL